MPPLVEAIITVKAKLTVDNLKNMYLDDCILARKSYGHYFKAG